MTDKPMSISDLYSPKSREILDGSRTETELLAAHRQDIEQLAEAARSFGKAMQNTAARIVAVLDDPRFKLDPTLLRQIADIVGGVHVLIMAVDGGWLPHYTSPQINWGDNLDAESVSCAYEAHYREHWPEIKMQFRQLVTNLDIDDEAKSTFEEALSAHEHGFYRSTVRLIFPELERVARTEFFNDSVAHPVTSQNRLRKEALSLTSDKVHPGGFALGALAEKLTQHIYEKAETDEARARFQASAIPNRHAALHGLVSYASHQSSINTLIIADFSFQVITAVKRTTSA